MSLHAPCAALRPWVCAIWSSDAAGPPSHAREWVLPNGQIHLAIRLNARVLRLFDNSGAEARGIADAVVAGPHDKAYLKEVSETGPSCGVLLRPGAARALLGVAPESLRNRHVALDALWGTRARELVERINLAATSCERVACLQRALVARLQPVHALHPQVAQALRGLAQGARIERLARDAGYSPRRFTTLFDQCIGLPPKRYARLQRFAGTLPAAAADVPWIEIALASGYSDQAHYAREFRAMAQMSPGEYRRAVPRGLRHVPAIGPAPSRVPRPA